MRRKHLVGSTSCVRQHGDRLVDLGKLFQVLREPLLSVLIQPGAELQKFTRERCIPDTFTGAARGLSKSGINNSSHEGADGAASMFSDAGRAFPAECR